MDMCIICDEITATGLSFAGIKNTVVANEKNIEKVLEEADAPIIGITHGLYIHVAQKVRRMQGPDKIIVEIPDRTGKGEGVEKLIRDAIGFEVKK
ncbi:MAG: hypothetical protein MSIBF_06055 [Candidatus Altiarchaeales archaeon IMC4]|nr:MAG: hypothetical protein MSIBF_06055 [Candidatus Altiarchaeales archaeon IMC4]